MKYPGITVPQRSVDDILQEMEGKVQRIKKYHRESYTFSLQVLMTWRQIRPMFKLFPYCSLTIHQILLKLQYFDITLMQNLMITFLWKRKTLAMTGAHCNLTCSILSKIAFRWRFFAVKKNVTINNCSSPWACCGKIGNHRRFRQLSLRHGPELNISEVFFVCDTCKFRFPSAHLT